MSETSNAESVAAQVDRVVLPSPDVIRAEARAILAETDLLELATAIRDGERLDSYEPFAAWLAADRPSGLHLRQMADAIMWKLRELKATEELKAIQKTALQYVLEDR